jgi:hypothetical protein
MNLKENKFRVLRKLIIITISSLFFSYGAFSQSTGTSTVTGTVVDPQGNYVPGAKVALISDKGSRRDVITNEAGTYTFASIQPGTYTVEVEASGFKRASVSAFQALVDKPTEVSVQLEVGQVSETVTVTGAGIENIINTQDASLGNNFVSRQIVNLPLQGRNVADLLSLQPGVTPDGSVAGSRSDQANITLDGVDVNEQQRGDAFSPVLRVNPDSVDEFRVTTSNPDASKGRSAGAQISLITKSGTNEFHGALYEYHRDSSTAANNYLNNLAGVARPKLVRNLFGGSLGGPIVKDRFFFFYNYEGMREAKGLPVVQTVPLPGLGQGIIKFRDNEGNLVTLDANQINALTSSGAQVVDVNPAALSVLAAAASRYPANDFTVGDSLNTAGFRFNVPAPVKQNAHTLRLDWNATEDQKHTFSFRANYYQDNTVSATETLFQAFPDTPPISIWSHPFGLALTHTWLIKSNITNRFSYGLTRLAFSSQGDSSENTITFRDVFQPFNFARTLNRINPTHNFTDDFTWIKGNHNLQFGTNIRIIRNKRTGFASAFDTAVANFGYYQGSGNVLLTPLNEYLQATTGDPERTVGSGWTRNVQGALTAVLGRLSQYSANFNFGLNGEPLAAGEPTVREWATEEYEFYAQDVWKLKPNLTLSLGLRYGLSKPVYETQGFQAAPSIPLQEYFQSRIDASRVGQNFDQPLIVDLAGPKNNRPGFYKTDKNNWQPRISVAWQPNFKNGWLGTLLGREQESVFRGGFAITNDYFGQQLAVAFDANNTLGFSSTSDISANTYNITGNPAPLFTGLGMSIRDLPGINVPSNLVFPLQQPADAVRRIEFSLDTNLKSPTNYSWNVSYGRKLPFNMYMDVSYIGRSVRNLLAQRDVMMPNNIVDPASNQSYYEAATALELQLRAGVPRDQITAQPFFENLYSAGSLDFFGLGGTNTQAVYDLFDPKVFGVGLNDWTTIQSVLDDNSGSRLFYQSQYGALFSWGTIARSDYNALAISVRQRAKGLTWDFNYTFSKSMDDASGLQTSDPFASGVILNPLRQRDSYAISDFDLTHVINFNSVWEIPIGRDRQLFSGMNKFANIFLGGWQLSSIFRYNTGYPVVNGIFFDDAGWVTNWNLKSQVVPLQPIETGNNKTSGTNGVPNLFADPQAAYNSFRSPLPGESGSRNILRVPSYVVLDMGLAKSFEMPWNENHRVTFRWDVFNVTNTARFTYSNTGFGLGYQPDKNTAPDNFGNFNAQQGSPRIMQFALRFDF